MVKARSDNLLVILNSFVEDEDNATESQDDEDMTSQKEWFAAINCGGLTRCTNEFYIFIRALQQETKSHLASKAADPFHFLGKPKELGGGGISESSLKS